MKRYIIIVLVVFSACTSLKDKEIVGEFTYQEWMELSNQNYLPTYSFTHDEALLSNLKLQTKEINVNFVIFATSYCNECIDNLPNIISIFEKIDLDQSRYVIVGLDDYLTDNTNKYSYYKVRTTPSVILLSDGKLIGEVVYPNVQWLSSFVELLSVFSE